MEEENARLSLEEKARLTACYTRMLTAIGDFKVHVRYGAERPIVADSPESIEASAEELLREYRTRRPTS
jgi:hypothetical protein